MSAPHVPQPVPQNSNGEPTDHALGRSRGGWGSKFHLVVDGQAIPLAAVVSAGQAHDSARFIELMEKVRPPRWTGWPLQTAGDKGYSYTKVRRWLKRRGIEAVIPQRSDQIEREGRCPLDRRAYRRRAKVENSVGWLKENRPVGTRYDKLASSVLAFVNLAIIHRYLRILAPDDPSNRT
jgi:transposase